MKAECISCKSKFVTQKDEFYCKRCRRKMFTPYLIAAVVAPSCVFATYMVY